MNRFWEGNGTDLQAGKGAADQFLPPTVRGLWKAYRGLRHQRAVWSALKIRPENNMHDITDITSGGDHPFTASWMRSLSFRLFCFHQLCFIGCVINKGGYGLEKIISLNWESLRLLILSVYLSRLMRLLCWTLMAACQTAGGGGVDFCQGKYWAGGGCWNKK